MSPSPTTPPVRPAAQHGHASSPGHDSRPTIVFVHGAWHGPWCWFALRDRMDQLGWRTQAVQLPSATSAICEPLPTLRDDVAAITTAVAASDTPVVIVAHSYGGAPATEVAARHPDKVAHLMYIAAYVPQQGQNLYSIHGLATPAESKGAIPVPNDPITMLYADVAPRTAEAAVARLVPQSIQSWVDPLESAPAEDVATSYLVCTNDQALPPAMQEQFAARTGTTSHFNSGHSPFLSHPHALAAHLEHTLRESARPHPPQLITAAHY